MWEIEHCWIPMTDGNRLSARIWLPEASAPTPAILEYIPYRKRDMVRARDERNHPFFAENGYACLRVDMRGSGDSEGVMPDMYTAAELDDARQVIEWIAAQDWCNGRVGMFGTSWGGTSSLQASVDAPEALKAVVANCATIDRFEDDIHWMGGCILTDTIEWAATLPAILAAPPDSDAVGDGWLELWKSRLSNLTFPHENWLRENRRNPYWRHGSVRFQADRISCPVLCIGGWADRYSNQVMRLVNARPDICRGVVGPWGHHYPDQGEPGPAIGFQELALAWWDHWLKDGNSEMPDWPLLRLWQREFDPPQDRLQSRNGGWIELDSLKEVDNKCLCLSGSELLQTSPKSSGSCSVPYDLRHGQAAGDTGYFGRVGGLPLDQVTDDQRSLRFDTKPLEQPFEIVGSVELEIEFEATHEFPQLACRLCDVAPDGQSNLITRTVVDLALDDNLDGAREIEPSNTNTATITFPTIAYKLKPGHQLRLALGRSYWPLVWPKAEKADAKFIIAEGRLHLPVAPEKTRPLPRPFPAAQKLPKIENVKISVKGSLDRSSDEHQDGGFANRWHQPEVTLEIDAINTKFQYRTNAEYQIAPDGEPKCTIQHHIVIRRPDGVANIISKVVVSGNRKNLNSSANISASWNEEILLQKSSHGELSVKDSMLSDTAIASASAARNARSF